MIRCCSFKILNNLIFYIFQIYHCWGEGLPGPRLVAMRAGERGFVTGANYELRRLSWQTYPL